MEYALLADLSEADRRVVLSSMRRRRFGKGEVIFHEGDPGESIHLIAQGNVAIRVTTPLGDVATLAVLGVGASFGELAVLGASRLRTATAAAVDRVETLSLTRDAFDQLRAQHPPVVRVLLNALAAQVDRLSQQLLEALYVGADARVLRRLLDMTELFGATVPLTQEELAGLAGTTRPTVNRVLRDCEEAGVLTLGRGKVQVTDEVALRRRSRG